MIIITFFMSFSLGYLTLIYNTATSWRISSLSLLATNIPLATEVWNSLVYFLPNLFLLPFSKILFLDRVKAVSIVLIVYHLLVMPVHRHHIQPVNVFYNLNSSVTESYVGYIETTLLL